MIFLSRFIKSAAVLFLCVSSLVRADSGSGEFRFGETEADRELAAILRQEAALDQAAEEGAGEESLLLMAQQVASRYEDFLRKNPSHVYGWILCGKFLRSVGADGRALAAFRKADELEPDIPVVHQQMGVILADQGEYRVALPLLLRAVELAPEQPVYREDLGRFLQMYGKRLEADGVLEEGRAAVLAEEAFQEALLLKRDG